MTQTLKILYINVCAYMCVYFYVYVQFLKSSSFLWTQTARSLLQAQYTSLVQTASLWLTRWRQVSQHAVLCAGLSARQKLLSLPQAASSLGARDVGSLVFHCFWSKINAKEERDDMQGSASVFYKGHQWWPILEAEAWGALGKPVFLLRRKVVLTSRDTKILL